MKVRDGTMLIKVSGTGDAPVMVLFNVMASVDKNGKPEELIDASQLRVGGLVAASDTLAADAADEAIRTTVENVVDDDDEPLTWRVGDLPAMFRELIAVPINSVMDWDVSWGEVREEA